VSLGSFQYVPDVMKNTNVTRNCKDLPFITQFSNLGGIGVQKRLEGLPLFLRQRKLTFTPKHLLFSSDSLFLGDELL
jgi:hypothetical protein